MIFGNSRYINTFAYPRRGETLVLGIRDRASFNPDKYTYYTVVEGDTIDGISFRFYKTASLYWAILDANPKYQSELDILAGDIIAIPDYTEVVNTLG